MTTGSTAPQAQQSEWAWQWQHLEGHDEWLVRDWFHPNRLEDLAGKSVLDAGCGKGDYLRMAARYAKRAVGVDYNTAAIARERCRDLDNVEFFEGDIARWDSGERFDVVFSIGVVHHTADPDATIAHLKTLLKPGGRLVVWVYSHEGNALNRWLVEPPKTVLLRLPRSVSWWLAHGLTAGIYPVVHSAYRLPLSFLPYYEYFGNWRRMTYRQNLANVFDKLNAPTTHFITRAQAERWVSDLEDTHVSPYMGVSWRVSGTRRR